MQTRKAASVFPEPVGAEISVVFPAKMCGHPCSCGSVGWPRRVRNQSRTRGCAQSRAEEPTRVGCVIFIETPIALPGHEPHDA